MLRLLLTALLALPWYAHADWATDRDGSAGYVTVTTLATAVDEAVPLFVVYLSDLPADFHTAMSTASDTDGKTIRVSTSDGATQIACYPVGVNTTSDTGALFIKGTGMSASSDTDYRIYVGNAALSMPAASDTYGRNAVFADYAGFYLPGVTLTDLTGAGRDLTAVNSPGTTASGYEGITAATYAKASSQYHKNDGTTAVTNWPLTLESLFYADTSTSTMDIVSIRYSASNTQIATLRFPSTNKVQGLFRSTGGVLSTAETTATLADDTWGYGAISRDANTGTSTAQLDGGTAGTNTTTIATLTLTNRLSIGASNTTPSAADFLDGRVAAAYLSASVRSADYVATMHDVWAGTVYSTGAWTANDSGCEDGSTGWLLFQTAANVAGGDTAWTNTANALDDDGDYASVTLSNEDLSDYLTLTNPAGVDIPTDATITAVHFRIKREDLNNDVEDFDIKAVKASSRVGNNLAVVGNWPATAATQDYGGTLLGTTWSPTDFGTNFGMAIQIRDTDVSADTGRVYVAWCKIDWVCGDDAAAKARGFFLLAD